MAARRNFSCDSASQTLEWMNAISDFLKPFKPLLDAHVVNFFKDKLWEMVDKEWMDCLCRESAENLLSIPSGLVLEHWPSSFKEFILTLRSLVLPREPELLHAMLPDLHVTSLGSVLAQGMNLKKKHEVEILASVVSKIALGVGAETIIDVGAGQGYLAQVLSFEHQLSVIALDASSHHATITAARAERIKKHYAAKLRKSQHGDEHLNVPQTITCHVLSSKTLIDLSTTLLHKETVEHQEVIGKGSGTGILEHSNVNIGKLSVLYHNQNAPSSLVLAGLHACGDLSVNMLRTFVECEQVKALICIGCCYNLLSEECFQKRNSLSGFPMSNGAKLFALNLGKNARDLACQSAERWKSLTPDAALQNFDLHVFRAAFQMVLDKYYPEVLSSSPSIGRQGKALRRQQVKRILHSRFDAEESIRFPSNIVKEHCKREASSQAISSGEVETNRNYQDLLPKDVPCITCSNERPDKYSLFEDFSKSGLARIGFTYSQDADLLRIWKETLPFSKLVGPYWSLRAALGPVVETFLLLDRLLFLQEKCSSVEVALLPLFDPTLSPRNVAIIARKI